MIIKYTNHSIIDKPLPSLFPVSFHFPGHLCVENVLTSPANKLGHVTK